MVDIYQALDGTKFYTELAAKMYMGLEYREVEWIDVTTMEEDAVDIRRYVVGAVKLLPELPDVIDNTRTL